MSKKKKSQTREQWQVIAGQRREWPQGFSPITRVIPDKRNKKPKYKERYDEV